MAAASASVTTYMAKKVAGHPMCDKHSGVLFPLCFMNSLSRCIRHPSAAASASPTGLTVGWRCTVAADSRSIRCAYYFGTMAIGRSPMCWPSCGAGNAGSPLPRSISALAIASTPGCKKPVPVRRVKEGVRGKGSPEEGFGLKAGVLQPPFPNHACPAARFN